MYFQASEIIIWQKNIREMFRESANSQEDKQPKAVDRHPMFNKSNLISEVLYGSPQVNPSNCSHFVDELERFRRDFAQYHKQQQDLKRQKTQVKLEKKLEQKENFLQNIDSKNYQQQAKKAFQNTVNLHLFDLGLKKNGMTSGLAINPINHQYQQSYGGKQLQKCESEEKLNRLVRLHHLQSKSTCGYNVINGQLNLPVEYIVPQQQQEGMHSRLLNYQEHYRLRIPQS